MNEEKLYKDHLDYTKYCISCRRKYLNYDDSGEILMRVYADKDMDQVTKRDIIKFVNKVYYDKLNADNKRLGRKTVRKGDKFEHIYVGEVDMYDQDKFITTSCSADQDDLDEAYWDDWAYCGGDDND